MHKCIVFERSGGRRSNLDLEMYVILAFAFAGSARPRRWLTDLLAVAQLHPRPGLHEVCSLYHERASRGMRSTLQRHEVRLFARRSMWQRWNKHRMPIVHLATDRGNSRMQAVQ